MWAEHHAHLIERGAGLRGQTTCLRPIGRQLCFVQLVAHRRRLCQLIIVPTIVEAAGMFVMFCFYFV